MNIPTENGYYVYLILCDNQSLYCGWTTNLQKRFEMHKSGKGAKYTRAHKPIKIYYYETFDNHRAARKREAAIKKMNHQEKINLKKT